MSPHPTAALGDVGSSDLALTLALRVCDFSHTEYRPQELSNVVWALGTLGVLCAPTLDTVLAGVSKYYCTLQELYKGTVLLPSGASGTACLAPPALHPCNCKLCASPPGTPGAPCLCCRW